MSLKNAYFLGIYTYEHLKCHAQLSLAWKLFYNLGARNWKYLSPFKKWQKKDGVPIHPKKWLEKIHDQIDYVQSELDFTASK